MWFATGSTVIVSLLGSVWAMWYEPICVVDVSIISFLNIWGVFLNVVTWFTLDLVLYLCVTFIVFLVSLFSCCFTFGITWCIGTGVPAFIFSNLYFGDFSIFYVTVKSWLLVGKNISGFLLVYLVGFHMGMPLLWEPSEVMHCWMDLIAVHFSFGFLPGSLIGVSFGLPPRLETSEVLLEGLLSWIFFLGSSMLTCVHFLILLKVLQVLDSVVHTLYLVRHDKFHPWKTSVVY